MADSIGSFDFFRLDGDIPDRGKTFLNITRPGEDGIGQKEMGQKTNVFELISIRGFSSRAAAKTECDNYAAYKGTVRTITRAGETHTNFFIHDVQRIGEIQQFANVSGPSATTGLYELTARWRLEWNGS